MNIQPYFTNDEITEIVQPFIGERFSRDITDAIKLKTSRLVRPYGGGYITTKDYIKDRINLMLDDDKIIRGIQFG